MNKKLLFDGTSTQSSLNVKFHGGGEYAKFVLRKSIEFGYCFDIVFSENRPIESDIHQLLEENKSIKVYYVKHKNEIYSLIERNNYDCFYSALPYKYTDYKLETVFIMVIHGLRSIELPWDEYRYKYYRNRLKRLFACIISKNGFLKSCLKRKHISLFSKLVKIENTRIITVSEHSKYSLLNFFPFLKPDKISVYYSPFDYFDMSFEPNQIITKDYFLIINANRYEKNAYRAMSAFDVLFSKGYLENKKVTVVGGLDLPFFNEIKNKDKFEQLPYVSYIELKKIFQNAFAFIYPSLNEGFGYPPLMAMEFNVPVIASSSTSIPEVCGNAALYFNPQSTDDLSNRILQINYNELLRKQLIYNGIRRVSDIKTNQEMQISNMLKLLFE
jgi:glycosyltransferase involved in cell wall biosynthesis